MRYAAAVVAVLGSLAVAGCSSSTKGHSQAADGGDVAACADGRCEVAVPAGTGITVPASMAVKDLTVTDVAAGLVTITLQDIGSTSNGTCTGECHLSTDNGATTVEMGEQAHLTENGLSVTVGSIAGGIAVLGIEPTG